MPKFRVRQLVRAKRDFVSPDGWGVIEGEVGIIVQVRREAGQYAVKFLDARHVRVVPEKELEQTE
jgi:hypothetical protein